MDIEIKVPSLGESETEATLVSWLKNSGDPVAVDDVIAEIESDKITLEITASDNGVIKETYKEAESTVTPGEVIGLIDTSAAVSTADAKPADANTEANETNTNVIDLKASVADAESRADVSDKQADQSETVKQESEVPKVEFAPNPEEFFPEVEETVAVERMEERLPMSHLRKRIATRLKEAQNTAAMLTTFNEVNMQPVMDLRAKYKDAFQKKYQVGLGFMSFFVKACSYASTRFPVVNAYIDGDEIVYHNYMDVGIAVSTQKGLVVPVLRDAGMLSFAQIEDGIASLAQRAREGGLLPDDLKGATFSITNGGVFGSLLSTPILNPPQSAILGMHAIQKRPVAEGDQVVIRPMMYLALTYDHRLIDGKDAVQYLVAVKEYLENPAMALLDL